MLSPCSAHALFNYKDGRAMQKHGLQPEPCVSAVRTTASQPEPDVRAVSLHRHSFGMLISRLNRAQFFIIKINITKLTIIN